MSSIINKYNKIKYTKLASAIIIDLVGLASYIIPVVGGSIDWAWGPISGVLIYLLFPNRKKMAVLGVAEELIPFTDFIPTASITWMLNYVKDNEKTLSAYVKREIGEEQLVKEILNTHNSDPDHLTR